MKINALVLKNKPRTCTTYPIRGTVAAVAFGVLPTVTFSQSVPDLGIASKITIAPRISVSETYTDNVALSSTAKKGDFVTQITPGINISSTGGRIRGSLDYSLSGLWYADNRESNQLQSTLYANGTVEVVDKWAFIDFTGNVGQQAISAFGAQATNDVSVNRNLTQTSIFTLTPRVSGSFGGLADYYASYNLTTSRSGSDAAADVDQQALALRLAGVGSGRLGLQWSVEANQQNIDYHDGRSTYDKWANAQVRYWVNPRFGVYVKTGYESSNYAAFRGQEGNFTALGLSYYPNEETQINVDRDQDGNYGAVAAWAPSKRTSVAYTLQRRLNGPLYNFVLNYRTPSTAWTFVDSMTTNYNQENLGQTSGSGTASLYALLSGQFAAGEPDATKREQYNASLRASGISPNATAVGGFLNRGAQRQRLQQLSFALFGSRSTLLVIASRTQDKRLDSLAAPGDSLSNALAINQDGILVTYSYLLNARSTLNFIANGQRSTGSLGVSSGTSTRTFNVNLSTQITRDTSANLGASRVRFESPVAPYTETSITGTVTVQF